MDICMSLKLKRSTVSAREAGWMRGDMNLVLLAPDQRPRRLRPVWPAYCQTCVLDVSWCVGCVPDLGAVLALLLHIRKGHPPL